MMMTSIDPKAQAILNERFHHDCLIALATEEDHRPFVRTVNAYYEDGAFYVITHALSRKMQQIEKNPRVAVSGDWFTAQGVGENQGHILKAENARVAAMLRAAFAAWYQNGHINEADENTCILRIRLEKGTLFSHGTRYDLEF